MYVFISLCVCVFFTAFTHLVLASCTCMCPTNTKHWTQNNIHPAWQKKIPRATIPAKVRFVTHQKLVAMGKVLIRLFISDASPKLGMREIWGSMEWERRRITVSRMVALTWFWLGSSYTSFKITVLILYTSQGKIILLKINSVTTPYNPTDDSKIINMQCCQPDVAQQIFCHIKRTFKLYSVFRQVHT